MAEFSGCPGSRMQEFSNNKPTQQEEGKRVSHLKQWPVQLHLVSPEAPYYQGADLLLSADCVAYTIGDFHKDYLQDNSLAIACPKLDQGLDTYVEKLTDMIDRAKVNTITVMIMQVPCCTGLLQVAKQALMNATRKVPLKAVVISIQGDILQEEWIS